MKEEIKAMIKNFKTIAVYKRTKTKEKNIIHRRSLDQTFNSTVLFWKKIYKRSKLGDVKGQRCMECIFPLF